jgi:hypothetical protein
MSLVQPGDNPLSATKRGFTWNNQISPAKLAGQLRYAVLGTGQLHPVEVYRTIAWLFLIVWCESELLEDGSTMASKSRLIGRLSVI